MTTELSSTWTALLGPLSATIHLSPARGTSPKASASARHFGKLLLAKQLRGAGSLLRHVTGGLDPS